MKFEVTAPVAASQQATSREWTREQLLDGLGPYIGYILPKLQFATPVMEEVRLRLPETERSPIVTRNVHPECGLFIRIREKQIKQGTMIFMATSYTPCLGCALFFTAYNQSSQKHLIVDLPQMVICEAQSTWCMPALGDKNDLQNMESLCMEEFTREFTLMLMERNDAMQYAYMNSEAGRLAAEDEMRRLALIPVPDHIPF